MQLDDVIFFSDLPSIDLHGYDSEYATFKVLEFINDNKIMKNDIICIIHGIGTGKLKEAVHKTLKLSKDVIDYKLAFNNIGCTLVKIKI